MSKWRDKIQCPVGALQLCNLAQGLSNHFQEEMTPMSRMGTDEMGDLGSRPRKWEQTVACWEMEGLWLDTSMEVFMELAKREASKTMQKLEAMKGLEGYVKECDLISRAMKCQRRNLKEE